MGRAYKSQLRVTNGPEDKGVVQPKIKMNLNGRDSGRPLPNNGANFDRCRLHLPKPNPRWTRPKVHWRPCRSDSPITTCTFPKMLSP